MKINGKPIPILILLIIVLNINLPILTKANVTTDTLSIPQNKRYRSWLKTFERSKAGFIIKPLFKEMAKHLKW